MKKRLHTTYALIAGLVMLFVVSCGNPHTYWGVEDGYYDGPVRAGYFVSGDNGYYGGHYRHKNYKKAKKRYKKYKKAQKKYRKAQKKYYKEMYKKRHHHHDDDD